MTDTDDGSATATPRDTSAGAGSQSAGYGRADRHERRNSRDADGSNDRGVSDLIGFVLTFMVIVSSVALVSTYGFSALEEFKTGEQQNNAERAFVILADNFNDLRDGAAPRRGGELNLGGGSLAFLNDTEITVAVDGTVVDTIHPATVRYRRGETDIAYQAGGTFRKDGPQPSIVQVPPEFRCSASRGMVSVPVLDGRTGRQISGSVVRVVGVARESRFLYPTSRSGSGSARVGTDGVHGNPVALELTVDSPYDSGWAQYLMREESGWKRTAPDTYQCTTDRVYVETSRVRVGFIT